MTHPELNVSLRLGLLHCAILASLLITSFVSDISCIGLAVWAVSGPLAALQSLSIFVVIRGLNPSLVHWGAISSALGWALPLIVSIRMLPLIKRYDLRVIGPVWLFCLVAIICSIATSQALAVSIMKAASLAVVAAAVLVASFRLTRSEVTALGRWMRTLALVVAALSLISLTRPNIAYYPDTNLLQGILGQPQALGAFLAPFSALYFSSWLFGDNRPKPVSLMVMGLLLLCMLLTLSRIAAIATLLGTTIPLMRGRPSTIRSAVSDWGRVLGASALLVIIWGVSDLSGGGITSSINGFIFKRGEHEVSEAFVASRGGGSLSQLKNFASSPLVGHGFGVYADGAFPSGIVKFAGIPVSAPVEKGVLPTAVLEETGVVGFLFFSYMIFVLVRRLWKGTDRAVLAMFFACLFINLGESVLLSPGNIGLHVWLIIGWCLRAGSLDSRVGDNASLEAKTRVPILKRFANLLD